MTLPAQSGMHTLLKDAYFFDSHSTTIPYRNQSALDVYFVLVKETPSWVNRLMALRNYIVGFLGLKNLGHMADIDAAKPNAEYRAGDKVGIFSIYSVSDQEIILEDRDKHLDVRVSFFVEPAGETATVHASTVVQVKNWLGKLYMFFVAPVHQVIVPTSLKKLQRAENQL
ncbi:DUF2867 domain-containing protein [Photobacterium sp. CCB-ST2H9]|uniref:DUF2867 domain-containing protein n=1 Tax=unclassified Photobacterium TaxID=2628852 RepID=UPI0020066379|nr:DUF2867 domain-containing protein [Photobacterium sp. CCB-ST2H9]UTM59532.1 DUF2867 domain-containing protein [Photobacterium sp. CCB-ST2H9]